MRGPARRVSCAPILSSESKDISRDESSYLFTSESVSEGHPDKIADQISDAVLDAILAQDKRARVACETMVKTGVAIVAGEVTTTRLGRHRGARAQGHQRHRLRQLRRRLRRPHLRDHQHARQAVARHQPGRRPQEAGRTGRGRPGPDVRLRLQRGAGVHAGADLLLAPPGRAAGQGAQEKKSQLPWLRPDAKSQVTLRYENGNNDRRPRRRRAVDAARPGHQAEGPGRGACTSTILKPVLPKKWLRALPKNKFHINPTGKFVIGGPVGDCGLTGRKIIVDTYGGMARHGGGAFSGKDPSKVDRSAAYAARYVAKNIVAAGLADRCEVQVSLRDRRGRADLDLGHHLRHRQDRRREDREADPQALRPAPVRHHQDARPDPPDLPADRRLRPLRPQAARRSSYVDGDGKKHTATAFSWEKTDKADELRKDAGLKR